MHSSRMRTARSLTVSRSICCGTHAPLPHMPPHHAHPLPHMPPYHACPPAMHIPPATHTTPLPHMPPHHAHPLPHMPPYHACPPRHAHPPATHTTPLPCMPPVMHTPLPCTPSPSTMPPLPRVMQAPPVDRQTPVKTQPSQTSFACGNKSLGFHNRKKTCGDF